MKRTACVLALAGCGRMRPSLALLAIASGCGRIGFDTPTTDAPGADALGADALDIATGPFSPPTLISTINTGMDEQEPTFTADRLEMIFRVGPVTDLDLYVSRRASTLDPWGPPQPIAELNSTMTSDHGPGVSPDGLTLWFASNRGGAADIWYTTRPDRQSPWTTPQPAGLPNFGSALSGPMVDSTGLWFLVQATDFDIWHATGTPPASWDPPAPATDINSTGGEGSPRTYGGSRYIVFNSTRIGVTSHDLFTATRNSITEPFSNIVPIDELNMVGSDEWDFWISEDGHYGVFGSNRVAGGGGYRLYETSR